MRKLALALGVAVALTSCGPDPGVSKSERLRVGITSGIQVITFDGHEYLAYDTGRGGSLCHAESCPCKSK
jgi:hypothetical protein